MFGPQLGEFQILGVKGLSAVTLLGISSIYGLAVLQESYTPAKGSEVMTHMWSSGCSCDL